MNPDHDSWKMLHLRSAGMFSNVNEVIEQLRLAEQGGYQFTIDWQASCYRDSNRPGDPWEYYFEPCFNWPGGIAERQGLPPLPGGVPIACSRQNIITPRLDDGQCNPLLLPRDRFGAHDLISRYLRLKPAVAAQIDAFQSANFRRRMIGLHIRGPGKTDDGVPELRRRYNETNEVPLQPFFQQTDEALRLLPDAGLFASSDSSRVIDAVCDRYGDRVITYPAQRSAFGEMHARHPANGDQCFLPYQLGLDVVSEAWLLSRTDIFVHGNSNVANFVLCAAPFLLHAYICA